MEIIMLCVYVAVLMVSMAAVVYLSYLGLNWFLDQPFSYTAVAQWIGFVVVMALITGGISYIMPHQWESLLSIVLSHFGCLLACHMFFLKMQSFVSIFYDKHLSTWISYGLLVIIYGLLSTSAVLLVTTNSHFIFMMGQMGVEYVMRTAILFSLLLESSLALT